MNEALHVALLLGLACVLCVESAGYSLNIPAARPPVPNRLFFSFAVEDIISNFSSRMKNPQLATLFGNCLPNTLDTTVISASSNDTFIITGDINAMWLRDSMTQVLPYIRLANQDANLLSMLHGLVLRQLRSIAIDSYANAYNEDANGNGHQSDFRKPPMQPSIFEGKYELDNLCAVVKLCYLIVNTTKDARFLLPHAQLWINVMTKVIDTMIAQQESTATQNGTYPYVFRRMPSVYPKNPAAFTGMVRSAFRPSDDDTVYDFLVPSNAMAVVALSQLAELCQILSSVFPSTYALQLQQLVVRSKLIAGIIQSGIDTAAFVDGTTAYEVDGFGNANMMDDANIPSLLSLPFLGYETGNYSTIRSWVLSEKNYWYFNGTAGRGVGSYHTGFGYIWPMSIIIQAMTTEDDNEIMECLQTLLVSANNTGFMHESFFKDDPSKFTRPWFAWANTLFGDLVLHLAEKKPHLIFDD